MSPAEKAAREALARWDDTTLETDDEMAARARADAGETQEQLAKEFGVSRSTIGLLTQCKTWKTVLGRR